MFENPGLISRESETYAPFMSQSKVSRPYIQCFLVMMQLELDSEDTYPFSMKLNECFKNLPKKICDAWISHLAVLAGGFLLAMSYQLITAPKNNKCISTKKVMMGKFHYNWKLKIYQMDSGKVVIYPASEFIIIKDKLVHSDEIYQVQQIGRYPNSNYLGFLAKYDKPKKDHITFEFTTFSTEPLKDDSCDNFLFSI